MLKRPSQMNSKFVIFHRMGLLSGIKPVIYDCCPNSCITYTEKYIHHQYCLFCQEPHLTPNGKPHHQFLYVPLIPHLQGYFSSSKMIQKMSYRSLYQRTDGQIGDVFDGPSATPILLQNYNLPPQIRTRLCNLIYLGYFLSPLDDEMADLAYGVPTFDTVEQTMFQMHAYIIFKLGDIIAIKRFMQIKGHNAVYPCRSCKIQATRSTGKTYYVPLQPPKSTSHQEFINTVTKLNGAMTKAERARITKATGIKDLLGLRQVGSLDYAWSMPWEWFHLLLENDIPNLMDLWTGQFKGLDTGDKDFEISQHIWEEIGKETTAAVKDILASFVHVLSNIATDRTFFTAESWNFWFIYLAPILLKGRFPKDKYYKHMCELADIMKITLQFHCTLEQYKPECLSTCTLTIHGLLHIAQGIQNCGPIWMTWTFYMERFCHMLQRIRRSDARPWSNLDISLVHTVYLEQLAVCFDLSEELASYIVVFETRSNTIKQVNYRDLEQIIIVTIPEDPFFGGLGGKTLALVLIIPWNTDRKDASEETVFMTSRKASVITNIHSLQATVGLIET
ncbi:hypothetical protein OG21DRAFT_1478565 [Imleria badia]|nr:hypothetical protein OG21DRAFT_1478565 [Imleria badia]